MGRVDEVDRGISDGLFIIGQGTVMSLEQVTKK
jgi:hypothetical protein